MALFYSNENFPLPVIQKLRQLGHDVLTSQESGNAGRSIPDEAVLAFACQQKRILLSINRKHFIRLHQQNAEHWGIIVCSIDKDFFSLAKRIHEVVENNSEMEGGLFRVNRPT